MRNELMTQPDENKLNLETAYELLAGRLPKAEAERIHRLCRDDARSAAVLAEAEAVTEAMRPPADAPPAGGVERIVTAHLGRTPRFRHWWSAAAATAVAAAAVVLVMVSLARLSLLLWNMMESHICHRRFMMLAWSISLLMQVRSGMRLIVTLF